MRQGNNPNKTKFAPAKLEKLVFQVITYLPTLSGYHEKRLEVVKTCLASMTRHANIEHSVIVCDNGSVPELTQWIRDEIKPALFIESDNFGKNTQRKMIAQMIQPDKVICYSDDDIYFYPDWLRPQLKLLDNLPRVACVSGYPVRTSFRWGNKNTLLWAKDNAEIQIGKFISVQEEKDFCVSVERDYETHARGTTNDMDYKIIFRVYNDLDSFRHLFIPRINFVSDKP